MAGGRLPSMIQSISAVTLATNDLARAARFYTALGFDPLSTAPGTLVSPVSAPDQPVWA
jgi:catechol 2,3-dioxygenase-like lactoylglutathione lyase family enzyme